MAKPSKTPTRWEKFERFESPSYWAEFCQDGVLTFSKDLAGELALQKGVSVLFDRGERVLAVRIPTRDDLGDGAVVSPHATRLNSIYVRSAMTAFSIKPCRVEMAWDSGLEAWTGKVA